MAADFECLHHRTRGLRDCESIAASKTKTRSKCKALTLDGEPCKNWALAGEQYCRLHERNAPRLSGFVRKNFGHTIAAVSLALTIYFGNQIPALIATFQPPNLATVLQKTPSMPPALKQSKVERAVLRVKRPALPAGLTAAPESLASEAPALPTSLVAARLPADLLTFISGQVALPTRSAADPLTAKPWTLPAPTGLTAEVR
jgi:hypothetical protein